MIERERKYRLRRDRVPKLLFELSKRGGTSRRETQLTVVYDDADQRLRREGRVLRLRTAGDRRELTAKTSRADEGLDKVREEATVAVGAGDPAAVLDAVGLRPALEYKKETELYDFAAVHVSIENVEPLGWFCEIEAASEAADIETVAKELGLEPADLEPRSYPELLAPPLPLRRAAPETATSVATTRSSSASALALGVVTAFALVAGVGYSSAFALAVALLALGLLLRLLGIAPAWLRG